MKFFRNPEMARLLFLCAGGSCGCSLGAFVFGFIRFGNSRDGVWVALLVFFVCLAFCLVFFAATAVRYRKLWVLSQDIDHFLHNGRKLRLSKYAEGELAILYSEVEKMAVRLSKQSEMLLSDKTYLADSLADISHQIRTPLTSINLLLAVCGNAELPEEKRTHALTEIKKMLDRIDFLIASLLKISQLDTGMAVFRQEPVGVKELIRGAYETIAVPMELKEQSFVCRIPEGVFYTGDFRWSSEAVLNILKNCMEHTPRKGTVGVQARKTGIFTEIVIEDNGSGLSPEDIPHLFDRFYKGKNSSEHSFGIGLALSRMIISRQNGVIKAENRKEGGARFILRFYHGVV